MPPTGLWSYLAPIVMCLIATTTVSTHVVGAADAAASPTSPPPFSITALQLTGNGVGTTSTLEAAVRDAAKKNPQTQLVSLPSHWLHRGVNVAAPEIGALAKQMKIAILSTGFGSGSSAEAHLAVLFNQDGEVVLNRTSVATKELDCGVDQPFTVAHLAIGGGLNSSVGIGVLQNREWECFHGPRALMLKQADVILVAGTDAPLPGAPTMALYTRAWENVLGQ